MALIFITVCFSFYEELLAHGVLKPLVSSVEGEVMKDGGHKNYVSPTGVSAIVKHFLKQSGSLVFYPFTLYLMSVSNIFDKDLVGEMIYLRRFLLSISQMFSFCS